MQKILYNIEEIDTIMAARPKACYTHITSKPTATNWKTIDPGKPLHFDKYTTFGKKQLAITLSHKIHPTTQLTHNGMPIPATLDNATVQNHNVRLARNDVHFSIVEHIMGILTATNHAIHITTEGGDSWPTESRCMNDYLAHIRSRSIETDHHIRHIKTPRPFMLQWEDGSYVGLLPPEGDDKKLSIDLMVSYPGTSIGTQRICVDVDDELATKIASARPPSYGMRKHMMNILNMIPGGKHIINIDPDHMLRFTKDTLLNPRHTEIFYPHGFDKWTEENLYIELVMHEVLDKLGVIGLLGGGEKLAGTFVCYKANHAMDLACMKQLQEERRLAGLR